MIPITTVWRALYGDSVTRGQRAGVNQYAVTCPFHSPDAHPSCHVNVEKNVFLCRSCGASGGVLSLVQQELQLDREAARAWLARI